MHRATENVGPVRCVQHQTHYELHCPLKVNSDKLARKSLFLWLSFVTRRTVFIGLLQIEHLPLAPRCPHRIRSYKRECPHGTITTPDRGAIRHTA